MNVVQREKRDKFKTQSRLKNELVRKDSSIGIRGATSLFSSYNANASRIPNKAPRYQFNNDTTHNTTTMGPPTSNPPRNLKRKVASSMSTKPESSSSGRARPRVIASDSAPDTTEGLCTPRHRPNALRYISSSSRGGHSGTRSARSSSTLAVQASVILAISEGRGMARGEIGIAAVDLRHPHLVLCQFSDTLLYTHTLTKINYFNPVEIIVPHTFCEGVQPSQLYQLIKDQYPLVTLTTVQRRHFNDASGRQHIQTLSAPQYSAVYLQVLHKFYALTAAAAVLKYVEYIQCIVFARESLKIEYHSSENTMIIDVGTATQLELVQPLIPSAGPTCCLLGVLGPTYTIGGIRALRANILQPSCKKEVIETKLDAVQDLIDNEDGLMSDLQDERTIGSNAWNVKSIARTIPTPAANTATPWELTYLIHSQKHDNPPRSCLEVMWLGFSETWSNSLIFDVIKKLYDVDKILLLCVETPNQNMDRLGEAQLNQMLLLKKTMDMVPKLVGALSNAACGRLRKIKMDLENPNYKEIAERIRNIIQEDAHLEKGAMGSLQRCFAVKAGINGLLDVARRTYSELIDDIQKMVEQLAESYDLPLRLNQNIMKGFHIILPIAHKNRRHFCIDDLPQIFIQVHHSGASVSMSTEELVVLDQQAKESLKEIQRMSNIVISSLLKELRPFMFSLYTLCENVAELDILLALAQASTIGSYIRPEFSTYLDIRNSVHPLLDYNSQVMPVPNDIFASPEQNFTIITGPNMGGKSIYIKQIAILQVMAQLGCFLPATNAVLRLCDRIFSRIGFNDSVELNASTYVFEMKETQHILKGLTSSSLVIIDELCRYVLHKYNLKSILERVYRGRHSPPAPGNFRISVVYSSEGTCTEEGTSMAWAICEELLLSDAFTFFTTHFMFLTRLQDLYFNVINRHTAVQEEEIIGTVPPQKRLVYKHKIELGITTIEYYGLALAAKTNLPEETVKMAMELAELVAQNKKHQEITTPLKNDEAVLYKLNADLRLKFRRNEISDGTNKQILDEFKIQNPQLLERLRIQDNKSNVRTDTSANNSSVINTKQSTSDISNFRNINDNNNQINSEYVQKIDGVCSTSGDAKIINKTEKKCTLVKSSDELLNTVMEDEENQNLDISQKSCIQNANDNLDNTENDVPQNYRNVKTIIEDAIYMNTINMSDVNDKNVYFEYSDDEIIDTGNECNEASIDDSGIAAALTQILDENSVEKEGSLSAPQMHSSMSIDEELMRETVSEINKEIYGSINLKNIVLTPPIDFKD